MSSSYVFTCDCRGVGQPFSGWFFEAFQQSPYSLFWTYKNIRFLAGPYSLLWYGLNLPAYFGYNVFFSYLLVVDVSLTLFLYYRVSVFWASIWSLFSLWWIGLDPVDFFVMMFTFLGRWKWQFLPIAVVTKLPFGSWLWTGNLGVWIWVFTDPNSFHGVENWSRYLIIGGFWIASLCGYLLSYRSRLSHPASSSLS